ncbi:hypothetical protein ACL02S_05815 [Nocardia sp. 004]|uniref:hypothetical protein n=1 Tax=Nocardia sp. 004 TaxID=3385978 RepID=UPI0039A10655
MDIVFNTLKCCMETIIKNLNLTLELDRSASSDHDLRIQYFTDAMHGLIRVHVGLSSCGSVQSTDSQLKEFRSRVVELISLNSRTLHQYIYISWNLTNQSLFEGWWESCIRRSEIALLLDEYPGAADVLGQENMEMVEEMDEVLRDNGPDVPPLRHQDIPSGLPDTHWWWRLPSGDPEEHRKFLSNFDEYY